MSFHKMTSEERPTITLEVVGPVAMGRVRAKLTRPTGVAGSGVVASVAFKAVAPGPAEVRIESITLTTPNGIVRPATPPAVRVTVAQ